MDDLSGLTVAELKARADGVNDVWLFAASVGAVPVCQTCADETGRIVRELEDRINAMEVGA